jgi:4-hydroxyacetophenone monooxygenase
MTIRTKSLAEASEAEIRDALAHASLPALMMSMIHMTGETALLDGPIRPQHALMFDLDAGIAPEEAAAIRERATQTILAYRATGEAIGVGLSRETVERMMGFALADGAISPEARGFLIEELSLDRSDPRRVDIAPRAIAARGDDFRVVIIGAGMSGLLLGYRLAQQGVPFTMLEKNDRVGGTWHENRYPGCRVDIASYSYSYSFEEGEWSHLFGPRAEVQDYF